jgi:hypothetical protein
MRKCNDCFMQGPLFQNMETFCNAIGMRDLLLKFEPFRIEVHNSEGVQRMKVCPSNYPVARFKKSKHYARVQMNTIISIMYI